MTEDELKIQKGLGLFPRDVFIEYCNSCEEDQPHEPFYLGMPSGQMFFRKRCCKCLLITRHYISSSSSVGRTHV